MAIYGTKQKEEENLHIETPPFAILDTIFAQILFGEDFACP